MPKNRNARPAPAAAKAGPLPVPKVLRQFVDKAIRNGDIPDTPATRSSWEQAFARNPAAAARSLGQRQAALKKSQAPRGVAAASRSHRNVAATRSGTPTRAFPNGLPPVLASGADPTVLASLPWQAQCAAARADTKGLYSLVERYSGPRGDTLAAVDAMEGGPLAIDVADIEWEAAAQAPVSAASAPEDYPRHWFRAEGLDNGGTAAPTAQARPQAGAEAAQWDPAAYRRAEEERIAAVQAGHLRYHDGSEHLALAAEHTAAYRQREQAVRDHMDRVHREQYG